jgi:hypothetical protein
MKLIELTKGKYTIVDDEDFEFLNQWKWCYLKGGYVVKSIKANGNKWINIYLHRAIMGVLCPKLQVDHINGNKLDNRKENLRIVTNQQNNMNKKPGLNFTSKYKGVYWNRDKNKWRSRVNVNGKAKHIGYFTSEIEAAKAYNKKAFELYGEYAWLNVV